ncbi:lisH domain and HEAT repeat-containing protein KIAA1468 [Pitangus sulphuratus]|nr:lisH domain and HEAT repeat-containing protein KIAA1468 [Pitangus sulphuratus]
MDVGVQMMALSRHDTFPAPKFVLPSPSRSPVLPWHLKEAAGPFAARSFLSPGPTTAVPRGRDFGAARAGKGHVALQALQYEGEEVELPFRPPPAWLWWKPIFPDRAGSISTLDSLDFARYSDDGNRETDERVAENEVPLQERKNYKSSPEIQEPIRPLEKRALNFLVNEFLLKNSYKLTSITFSDENHDQDFELWDDVGLNIPKPPDLLQLYRDFGNHHVTAKDMVDASVGVEDDELEADTPILGTVPVFETTPQSIEQCLIVQKLEDQISVLNSEKWSLLEQIQRLESEIDLLKNENFAVSTVYGVAPHPSLKQVPLTVSEDNGRYLDIKSSENDNKHESTEETSLALSAEVDSRTSKDDMLNSVPCKETEKLSSRTPSSKTAVHFDKPNSPAFGIYDRLDLDPGVIVSSHERQMILTGCVAFARHVGPTRVEAELLPQCWEQKEIRSSLVLSMLQQMLMEDKADLVREAVIKSLGIIMGYIDDPDKYQQEGEHGLDEHKLHMYLSALQSLIPSLFALVLQNAPFTSKAKLQGEVPQIEVTRFPRPVSPLQDVAIIIGSREQLAVLLQLYDYQLEHEGTTGWESLLWVVNQLLPQLIEIVGKINVASTACVHEFSRFFWRLCRTFGKIFTNTKVKPQFQEILRLSEENIDSTAGNGVLTKATVPIYATGVLTCYIQEEDRKLLVGFLEDVMTMLSLSHAPLDSLKASFVELGANPAYHELLLTVLWYGVVHTSALVRCTAARMFELTLRGMSEALVDKRVAPALVTLSSDPEFSVRIATIPAFGTIMETVTQRENNVIGTETKTCIISEFNPCNTLTTWFLVISEDLMVNHFLPGLKCLRTDMEHLSPEHEVILSSMIKECEQKVENKTVQEPQGSMSIAASLVSEDTKTKFLNKMGQLTTSGAMLANVFQRKNSCSARDSFVVMRPKRLLYG